MQVLVAACKIFSWGIWDLLIEAYKPLVAASGV